MTIKDFIDKCYFIAAQHPRSRRIDFENDICVKTNISSFKDSLEYRDQYILISSAIDDAAMYVELLEPFSRVLVFIDGAGRPITLEGDFQYISGHIDVLYSHLNLPN
jgi:hypothetical protein